MPGPSSHSSRTASRMASHAVMYCERGHLGAGNHRRWPRNSRTRPNPQGPRPGEVAQTQGIRLSNGTVQSAELHWYEAHGIGRRELKVKRFIP